MAARNYGFTRDPNVMGTMAIQPWYNKRTGEVFSAPDGAYEPPNADWVSGDKPADFIPTDLATGTRTDYATTDIDPSQSTLSPNFSDYIYRMLAKGEQAANLPFQPYTGQRFAGPSDLQRLGFQQYQNLGQPSQFGEATGIARLASSLAQNAGYTPGQFAAERVSPFALQQYQMNQPRDVYAERVSTQSIPAAQTGYRPDLQMYQMQAPSERVTSESFVQPGTAQSYMSPYMQAVVDKQTREATRQADIARGGRQARFAQAGAFGGSRQAIEEAEANRNLQQQLGDIQATGSQAAFQQAQQQFNQEQQARQAAQQANLGAGLTTGQQNLAALLGIQQLGAQQGLTAQQLNQQAALEAARMGEQSRQYGAGYGMQGIGQLLGAGQLMSGIGQQAGQFDLSRLQGMMGAGGIQQGFMQQPLDFGYQQWQESQKFPYQQATYMQSLLGGLPLAARPYDSGQSGMNALLQGAIGGLALGKAVGG